MDLTVHCRYVFWTNKSTTSIAQEIRSADRKKKGWLTMAGSLASGAASTEIISIGFAALLVWASALVQHLSNTVLRGSGYVLSDRSDAPEMSGFFGRATRTLSNNMESALMYIPPTLLVIVLGQGRRRKSLLCVRLHYRPVHLLGVILAENSWGTFFRMADRNDLLCCNVLRGCLTN